MNSSYADPNNRGDQQIIQNRTIKAGWLQGIDSLEYYNYLLNALYLQKKLKLLNVYTPTATYNTYIQNEVQRMKTVKYTNDEIKQLTTSFGVSHNSDTDVQILKGKKMYEMEKMEIINLGLY